jgi:protein-disulfide isomerase
VIRLAGGAVVLVVIAGLIAIGFFAGRDSDQAADGPTPDVNAALPEGVQSDTFGVPSGSGWTADNSAKLPTLEIWEDFQCPACGQVEKAAGAQIRALADDGLVKLLYRPATFLDNSLASKNAQNGNPNSSARATAAWGCAIDGGKGTQYHDAVFAAQPADEGEGYSEQLLLDLGAQVGVEDQAAFTTCVKDGRYLPWSANSNEAFVDAQVGGTPTGFLNGVELNSADLVGIEALSKKIAGATAE